MSAENHLILCPKCGEKTEVNVKGYWEEFSEKCANPNCEYILNIAQHHITRKIEVIGFWKGERSENNYTELKDFDVFIREGYKIDDIQFLIDPKYWIDIKMQALNEVEIPIDVLQKLLSSIVGLSTCQLFDQLKKSSHTLQLNLDRPMTNEFMNDIHDRFYGIVSDLYFYFRKNSTASNEDDDKLAGYKLTKEL